jgi:hypothetical protein
MPVASQEAALYQVIISFEIDEQGRLNIADQLISILTLQRRTSEYSRFTTRVNCLDEIVQGLQPRTSVLVRQGNSLAHLGDVFNWMIVVAVEKGVSQFRGQLFTYGCLAYARDTHQYDDAWAVFWILKAATGLQRTCSSRWR